MTDHPSVETLLTETDRDEIVRDAVVHLRSQGCTIHEIMTSLGIPVYSVRRYLASAGMVRHGARGRYAGLYEYKRKRYTIRELAELAGITHCGMWRRLKKHNGDVRKAVEGEGTQAQIIRNKEESRGYTS